MKEDLSFSAGKSQQHQGEGVGNQFDQENNSLSNYNTASNKTETQISDICCLLLRFIQFSIQPVVIYWFIVQFSHTT